MHVDLDQLAVVDNEADQRFEARLGDDLAVAEYRRKDDMIVFTHTEVPVALEGKGIANRLARIALDQARARELAVVPLCPFFASFIRRHAEYRDLVRPEYRHLIGGT